MAVLSHADLEALWVLAGGSQATADVAAAVAQAESGGNPSAILNTAYPRLPGYRPPSSGAQPEYSVGLWQVNELAHPQYATPFLLVPRSNAVAAVAISNGGASFTAWSTYKSGAYKRFLTSSGTPTAQPGTVTATATAFRAPNALGGYADFRNSVSRHVPTQLLRSAEAGARTLRILSRKSKVRG